MTTNLINFDNCKEMLYEFGGSDEKDYIIYNNSLYMLKYESKLEINKNISIFKDIEKFSSYRNNVYSEYYCCKIIKEILNLDVQEVLLGVKNNKLCVACKDFGNKNLIEFQKYRSSYGNMKQWFNPDINKILLQLENNKILKFISDIAIERFWITFIIDSIFANYDRHTGNWGYLSDGENINLAPIYDCGACLFSKYSDNHLEEILNDKSLYNQCLNLSNCNFTLNKKKLTYFNILNEFKNNKIVINSWIYIKNKFLNENNEFKEKEIYDILNNYNILSEIRKSFYFNIIKDRFYKIDKILK